MKTSASSTWMLTTFLLFFHLKKADAAISCYICSWSPQDKELEPDRCTTGNFDERRVRQINCQVGCEIVKILDSNGELLMFYRNCLMSSPNKFDYDRSNKKTTVMTEEEVFACDYDLCNASTVTSKSSILIILLTTLMTLLTNKITTFK